MQDNFSEIIEKNVSFRDSQVLDLGLDALRSDTLRFAREQTCTANSVHAWSKLGDAEILEAMGLVVVPKLGGPCKLTVAALLLFGKTEILRSLFPRQTIQVTAQLLDPEGYDYHEELRGNLLESRARLMAFATRNFPVGGVAPGSSGEDVRDLLFGEIFTNLLVHRDYSVSAPSRIVFQKERLTFENPSQPRKGGLVDLARSDSSPKNPLIYAFFKEMGRIREPGEGLGQLLRYGENYFGTRILAFDREIFKIIVTSNLDFPVRPEKKDEAMQPVFQDSSPMQDTGWGRHAPMGAVFEPEVESMQVKTGAMQVRTSIGIPTEGIPERTRRILSFCESPRNREEIQKHVGLNNRDHFRKEILLPLLRQGLLVASFPDKPNSPKQQYRTASAFVSRDP